ncbi:MAG: cyclic nucleotide-binding domain-containing protein [Pseudomonadota bacterium]
MRKALYILGDLDDRDLIWLAGAGALRALEPGTVIVEAGTPVQDLYFITAGEVAVITAGGETISQLGVGEVIGEMSFVEKRAPNVSAQASTAVRVLAVPRAALLAEFARNRGFAARFYRALAVFLSDRLRETTSAMAGGEPDQELDEGLLDTLHVAGDRMLRLLDLLEGRSKA